MPLSVIIVTYPNEVTAKRAVWPAGNKFAIDLDVCSRAKHSQDKKEDSTNESKGEFADEKKIHRYNRTFIKVAKETCEIDRGERETVNSNVSFHPCQQEGNNINRSGHFSIVFSYTERKLVARN